MNTVAGVPAGETEPATANKKPKLLFRGGWPRTSDTPLLHLDDALAVTVVWLSLVQNGMIDFLTTDLAARTLTTHSTVQDGCKQDL